MPKAVFFGTSIPLLAEIHSCCELTAVVTEKSRLSDELADFCTTRKVQLLVANKSGDIPLLDAEIGICFGFGLIFQTAFLEKNAYPIINIHPGSLKTNRGRHPLHWNIFLNERDTHVVFHQITPNIDEGPVLLETSFLRNPDWSLSTLEDKVLSYAVHNISQVIQDYLQSKREFPVTRDGAYRPRFNPPSDINPDQMDSRDLIALTKIQSKYGGLKVGSNFYIDAKLATPAFKENNWQVYKCKDNVFVALKEKDS